MWGQWPPAALFASQIRASPQCVYLAVNRAVRGFAARYAAPLLISWRLCMHIVATVKNAVKRYVSNGLVLG